MEIQLFDRQAIPDLNWPHASDYEKKYLVPLYSLGVEKFLSNVATRLYLLQCGPYLFPTTVNETEYENAYVCSPYTGYISYAKQELWKLRNKALEKALTALIHILSGPLKVSKINQLVCVNNWLLSTNLYPEWHGEGLEKINRFLIAEFPEHALMFRSLNWHTNRALMHELQKAGYVLIPSREVFIFDKKLKKYIRKRNTVIDTKLLQKTQFKIVTHDEILPGDYARITELYHLLYSKYSTCSPHFTDQFISHCHQNRLLNMQGVRGQEGRLEAIVGSFTRNGVMATPLVGYNIERPREEALFRMITILAIQEAFKNDLVFNISAGVSQFKRWRGANGFVEYSAVYYKHLPFHRQTVWRLMQLLMEKIGVVLLQKFQF